VQIVEMVMEAKRDYEDPGNLFITRDGAAFQGLTDWYAKLHTSERAPYPQLPLNSYRSVFITDRMENPCTPGPSNQGAAVIMGNSVGTWDRAYWKNKRLREAEQAGKAMAVYRESLLLQGEDD
jgi:hypothetical protein